VKFDGAKSKPGNDNGIKSGNVYFDSLLETYSDFGFLDQPGEREELGLYTRAPIFHSHKSGDVRLKLIPDPLALV